MKPLFSAILETIVLAVSILLVLLCAKLLKFESTYDNYSEKYPDRVITVGNAMEYFPEGTTPTPEEASVILGQKWLGKDSGKTVPIPIAKIFCIKVGEKTAKVLELYYFIVFVESILCLIFGITLPCSLYRHVDPAKAINNFFIDENYVYEDSDGMTYGHVGETRAGIVNLLLLLLMLSVATIWCTFMPLLILINFTVGIIMLICRLAGVKASNASAKAKIKAEEGKSGSDTYRIVVDKGLFMVSGDKHPDRGLYFKEYWNAVTARRLMELDERVFTFNADDAKETIIYGDENLHKNFQISQAMSLFGLLFSPSGRKKSAAIETEIENNSYTFTRFRRGDKLYEYIIKSKRCEKYALIRLPMNCSLMHAIMACDAKGEEFDAIAWNRWNRQSDSSKLSILSCHSGWIDPPASEERRG